MVDASNFQPSRPYRNYRGRDLEIREDPFHLELGVSADGLSQDTAAEALPIDGRRLHSHADEFQARGPDVARRVRRSVESCEDSDDRAAAARIGAVDLRVDELEVVCVHDGDHPDAISRGVANDT